MAIYIGTILAGRNGGIPVYAMRFDNKARFYDYCDDLLAMHDSRVTQSMTIEQLCDAIADLGPGIGSRWHKRIDRKTAMDCGKYGNLYL